MFTHYIVGEHKWYDITEDMKCEDAFPFFLLYGPSWGPFGWENSWGRKPFDGRLLGWGFSLKGFVKGSQVEHPKPEDLEVRIIFSESY